MAGDSKWAYRTLLLHGDGTNGSTTFKDEVSAGNLTRTGTPVISTAQSRFGGSSIYFDGAAGYLTTSAASCNLGAGDFCVEAWVYITSLPTYAGIVDARSNASMQSWAFGVWNTSGANRLDFLYGSTRITATSTVVPLNTWAHVAVVRSSGTIRFYLNGVADANSVAYSGAISASATAPRIGALLDPLYSQMYFDEVRITAGYAEYFGGFTTPVLAFPNAPKIAGTVQDASGGFIKRTVRVYRRDSGAFVGGALSDPSTGAWSIQTTDTAEHFAVAYDAAGDPYGGNVTLALVFDGANNSTAFTDLGGRTAAGNGGIKIVTDAAGFEGVMCDFDGIDDYIALTGGSQLNLPGDFTLDIRGKWTNASSYQFLMGGPVNASGYCMIAINVSAQGQVGIGQANVGWPVTFTGAGLQNNTMAHIRICRSGNTNRLFVNGVKCGASVTDLSNHTFNPTVWIGHQSGGSPMAGRLDEIVLYRGVALNTTDASFTPPASAFSFLSGGAENALVYDRLVPA